MLSQLQLAEPLVSALVQLLTANLNTTIDSLNATVTDGYTVDHVVKVLPFVPVPSTLQGGLPLVGVQDLPAEFEDDLQYSMHALHRYAVVAIVQNADHQALTWQLRRTVQAVANVIQADRMLGGAAGTGGVMRNVGGAWSVQFEGTEPGPLLGDVDPVSPEAPPRSYMSYTALLLSSRRAEILQ